MEGGDEEGGNEGEAKDAADGSVEESGKGSSKEDANEATQGDDEQSKVDYLGKDGTNNLSHSTSHALVEVDSHSCTSLALFINLLICY